MKRLLSILLSVMMIFSCGLVTTSVAYAATVKSPSDVKTEIDVDVTVNGNKTNDIDYTVDSKDPHKITFIYIGDGDFLAWTFYDKEGNILVEGVDYEVVSDDDNGVITIVFADGVESVVADASVDEKEPVEPTTKKEKTTKKTDKKPTSPQTGAASAAGLAVAGAGAAILVALKKKNDAE